MSKLFVASSVLCGLAALVLVPSSGCSSTSRPADETTGTTSAGLVVALDAGFKVHDIVISQVYGGGGVDPTPAFKNDFVELFNASQNEVSLVGMSIQVSGAGHVGSFGQDAATLLPLTGSILPGAYYLIKLDSGGTSGSDVPTPDLVGTLFLDPNSDMVALAGTTDALNCGGSASRCGTKTLDLVGFGDTRAPDYEGAGAIAALDTTKAAIRKGGGCVDTDKNAADFDIGAPNPRNKTTVARCAVDAGVEAGPKPDVSIPPVVDPPLGEETPFDGGVFKDAGTHLPSAGDDDSGCAMRPAPSSNAGTAIFGLVAALGLALASRRRR